MKIEHQPIHTHSPRQPNSNRSSSSPRPNRSNKKLESQNFRVSSPRTRAGSQEQQELRIRELEDKVAESPESQAQQATSILELQAQVGELGKLQGRCVSISKALSIGHLRGVVLEMQTRLGETQDRDEKTEIDYIVSQITESAIHNIFDRLPFPPSAPPLKRVSNERDKEAIQTAGDILEVFGKGGECIVVQKE